MQQRNISGLIFTLFFSASLMSTAVAQETMVELDDGKATAIRNLSIEGVTYDVTFVGLTTANSVYGDPPGVFDFSTSGSASAAVDAVNAQLTMAEALGVGPAGGTETRVYSLGFGFRTVAGVGSVDVWEGALVEIDQPWIRPTDSDLLTYSLDERIYADFSVVDGSFSITPGITGSWFDQARSGEGFNVEVIGAVNALQLVAYFYTYDEAGNQMWLTGVGPITGDTATVPVEVTSGPVFGEDFDPEEDVMREDWGTLTFTFTSCDAGSVMYNSTLGFGSGMFNIVRLTSVTTLPCP